MASVDSATAAEEIYGCGGGLDGRVAQLVSSCCWCWPWFNRGGATNCWDFSREVVLRFRGKVLAEKGGGAMMTVVERESCADCLLVGREDREFVFS
ncbi:hypothetical protein NC653_015338 [Populus alba x Populus x berolinensis]|uniref:Uncharacterized protein n=1 Tax=Populus alba x Populus x berolinensis TaxID=444605 RepID=A0AAD6QKA6_9ROSI|nr:hypothetical protein NC653_015338 [Populus alba x Populus x berolinensis]